MNRNGYTKQLYSVKELAEEAGVSLTAIYDAWDDGKFPNSSKAGTLHVIVRKDALAYINRKEAKSEEVE